MATLEQPASPPARPRPMAAGWIKPLVFLAVIGGLGASGYYFASSAFDSDGPQLDENLLTYTVEKGDLLITVREDGNLESANNVDVKCEVAGGSTIIYIVPDGSIVEEGDLIVELDKSTLTDQINQQRNTYEKARATVIQAEQDFQVAKISIEEYEQGTFKQSLQDAEAQIKIAMENLRNSQNAVSHAERMFRKGYVSKLELETQEFAVQRAQLELDSAETAREVLVNYTKVKTLEDLKAQRDIAEAKLRSEQAAFEIEENKLQRLEDQLEKCEIIAPASGMVVYANNEGGGWRGSDGPSVEEGATVRERQSLVKLPDLANMQVNVKVHESKVEQLDQGMPALIRVQGRQWQGTVESIANQPEPTSRWAGNVKEYATNVRVEGNADGLRPGMTAEVEILVAELSDVTLAPVSAIVDAGSTHYCWVTIDGKIERREVEIGMTDGEFVAIKTGLSEGEEVLRNPRAVVDEAKEVSSDKMDDDSRKFGPRRAKSETEDVPSRKGKAAAGETGQASNGQAGSRGGERADQSGSRGGGGMPNKDQMVEGMMRMDTDGDGKISKEEAPERMQGRFDSIDTNSDGFIDRAEIEAMVSKFSGG